MSDLSQQANIKRSWEQPEGASFDQWMESRVARFATRRYDWNALKFQADYDPKYRRAQMRYLGTGGTGVAADTNTVPAEHFTFSTMVIPAGHEGPPHLHTDVEEVFFHCAKAFLRSDTWDPSTWNPTAVPSVAQLAKAIRYDWSLEELEARYSEDNIRKVLY